MEKNREKEVETLEIWKALILFAVMGTVLSLIGNDRLMELCLKINSMGNKALFIFGIFLIILVVLRKLFKKHIEVIYLILSPRWIIAWIILHMKDLFLKTDYIDVKICSVIFIFVLFYIFSMKEYSFKTKVQVILIWLYSYLPNFMDGSDGDSIGARLTIVAVVIMLPIIFRNLTPEQRERILDDYEENRRRDRERQKELIEKLDARRRFEDRWSNR